MLEKTSLTLDKINKQLLGTILRVVGYGSVMIGVTVQPFDGLLVVLGAGTIIEGIILIRD